MTLCGYKMIFGGGGATREKVKHTDLRRKWKRIVVGSARVGSNGKGFLLRRNIPFRFLPYRRLPIYPPFSSRAIGDLSFFYRFTSDLLDPARTGTDLSPFTPIFFFFQILSRFIFVESYEPIESRFAWPSSNLGSQNKISNGHLIDPVTRFIRTARNQFEQGCRLTLSIWTKSVWFRMEVYPTRVWDVPHHLNFLTLVSFPIAIQLAWIRIHRKYDRIYFLFFVICLSQEHIYLWESEIISLFAQWIIGEIMEDTGLNFPFQSSATGSSLRRILT